MLTQLQSRSAALGLLGLLAFSGIAAAQQPWPVFGRNAQHTGSSSAIGPSSASLKWITPLRPGATGIFTQLENVSPVVAADGSTYFGENGNLVALNADGSVRWQIPTGSAAEAAAVASDGTVYGSSATGLIAVQPNGQSKWTFNAREPLTSPVLAQDGTIYANGANVVYAIRPDGSRKWASSFRAGPATPVTLASDNSILATARVCTALAFFPETGVFCIQFRVDIYRLQAANGNSALVRSFERLSDSDVPSTLSSGSNGNLYLTIGSTLFGLSNSGAVVWSQTLICCSSSAVAISFVADPLGTLYVETFGGSTGKTVYAFTAAGAPLWQRQVPGEGAPARQPAVGGDGVIYGATSGDSFFALSPSGQVLWSYAVVIEPDYQAFRFSSPAIAADGTVHVIAAERISETNQDARRVLAFR